MLQFPNRTAQTGTYQDDTIDYVDLSAGSALTGMVTFATKAVDDSWDTGDKVGILVERISDGAYQVWTALWDSENEYLVLDTLEESSATLTDGDAVNVRAVMTKAMLGEAFITPERASIVTLTGTAHDLDDSHAGKLVRCTNSSAVTLSLVATASPGVQFLIVQSGTGTVSIRRKAGSSDSVNGAASDTAVPIAKQYGSAYVYQYSEGYWEIIV